jgi:LytS/YehU family sensor histidine kinase
MAWRQSLVVWLGTACLWAVLTPVVLRLAKRFPIERKKWLPNSLLHLSCAMLLACIEVALFVVVTPYVGLPPIRNTFIANYAAIFAIDFHFDLLTYAGVLGVTQILDYYHKYQERELRASQLQTQLAEAQLGALRMQLHPHFLFNTLNAIVVLVRKNSGEEAVRMLTGLAELLRKTLQQMDSPEVTARQELEFINRYLEIERVRFGDRLRVVMEVEPDVLEASVPSLILQPLVENSIRHGIAKRTAAGLIEISVRRLGATLQIQVRDDGPGFPEGMDLTATAGIGLRNTCKRLERMFGSGQNLDLRNDARGGAVASVTIPFRSVPYPDSAERQVDV